MDLPLTRFLHDKKEVPGKILYSNANKKKKGYRKNWQGFFDFFIIVYSYSYIKRKKQSKPCKIFLIIF